MKDFIKTNAVIVWIAVIVVACSLLSLGLYAIVYPMQLGIERNAVENSKSFTDATNLALVNYMQDWQKLETKAADANGDANLVSTYRAQQKTDMDEICQTIARMKADTVAPLVNGFVAQHGGCK